jgi:RING finger/CHY zinc finger protein 1
MSTNPYDIRGCQHYARNNQILANCCNKWYDCRLCHNENNTHNINRKAIKMMRCNLCSHTQPVSNKCTQCNTKMGEYHCVECNLFDHDGLMKGTFHCNDCNICRTNDRKNYIHCHTCNHCIGTSHFYDHTCLSNNTRQKCPICLSSMHDSHEPLKILICGHALHNVCYINHSNTISNRMLGDNYICPICRLSIHSEDKIN